MASHPFWCQAISHHSLEDSRYRGMGHLGQCIIALASCFAAFLHGLSPIWCKAISQGDDDLTVFIWDEHILGERVNV